MRSLATTMLTMMLLASCGDDGVIYNRPPFSRSEHTFDFRNSEEFISRSAEFADDHQLEMSVNRFGDGKFSVLLYNRSINLSAVNTVHPSTITIGAISRSHPTPADQELARRYFSHMAPLLK